MATSKRTAVERVAILPLRNSVLFPLSVVPINVGRPRSVLLVEQLNGEEGVMVGVLTQRNSEVKEPTFDDLYEVGTLARVVKVVRLGADNYSVVLNGVGRFRVLREQGLEPYMQADVERIVEPPVARGVAEKAEQLRNATRGILALLPDLPKETSSILDNVKEPGALADLIASNFPEDQANISTRQKVLEAADIGERLDLVLHMVERQLEILRAKDQLALSVTEEMGRSQRDYVLRQQIKTIREELGEGAEDDEVEQLRDRVARAEMSPEADQAARRQLGRLSHMQPQSSEFQVSRTYVEWLADLPWNRRTPDTLDVKNVRRCLDEDHYGLELVKKRIVEFTAVRQLRRDQRGPILLFVGPPGVGKTSLGKSIARAMGRRYGRIALGGVRDEAEIRGHRRTYVGALPGRIIVALKKAGVKNPVLVLDEVDKMGTDMRGDPASALLEALDPEQNNTFADNYIDVPFDLSEVMFLATANYRYAIPEALRDRMEIIEVPGYTRSEKRNIAKQFLIPKQLKEHALEKSQLDFTDEGIEAIVDQYTREAGVRGLEREIAAVCRNVAVQMADGSVVSGLVVEPSKLHELLGAPRHEQETVERAPKPGIVTTLGISDVGGELLLIEVNQMPGKGEIRVSGSMAKVMEESALTAFSLVRARAERLHLEHDFVRSIDLHMHIPRGGSVRDAAGAGVAMFVAVVSQLLNVPVRDDVCVLGELTLRGSILAVEGVKAKLLAAHRAQIREVVLPARNEADLEEVPEEVRRDLVIHLVSRIDEVLPFMFGPVSGEGSRRGSVAPSSQGEAQL
ncbi:MAG: endopeptidase La [Polyangiaceae bacterium]|nr:endopeptidase La [Polyangiaceae bacterium]